MSGLQTCRIERFNYRAHPARVEAYFVETVLPQMRRLGVPAQLFTAAYGLSPRHFWLVTEGVQRNGENLMQLLSWLPAGSELLEQVTSIITDHSSVLLADPEPAVKLDTQSYPMLHVETFHARTSPGELKDFFLYTAFPYFRRRGFFVKLFTTKPAPEVVQFWFITGITSFASLDSWPEMAAGEPEGREIMAQLLNMIDLPCANIIRKLA